MQSISIVLGIFCAFLISRVREGNEKPFGFVVGQIANPQIIRTFQYLDSLNRTETPRANAAILRNFRDESAELAVKDIIELLDDPDGSVQEEAARALGRIRSIQAVDALILRLLDEDSDIRIEAARSLGRIGDKKAVRALVGCLWESGEELQKACIEALADIGDEESIAQVMSFLRENRSERLRQISSAAAARLGIFEAAWDIYPRIITARTRTQRTQYAIAMADLLGKSGEFYQYVSGSASVLQKRQQRLLADFQQNMQNVYARQQKKKSRIKTDLIAKIRSALEEDRNREALQETVVFSKKLLGDLFGAELMEDGKDREFLFRIDQKLGVFAWMTEKADEFADGEEASGETARILTLLIVYFLAVY